MDGAEILPSRWVSRSRGTARVRTWRWPCTTNRVGESAGDDCLTGREADWEPNPSDSLRTFGVVVQALREHAVDRATEWVVLPSLFLSLFLKELRAGRTGVS